MKPHVHNQELFHVKMILKLWISILFFMKNVFHILWVVSTSFIDIPFSAMFFRQEKSRRPVVNWIILSQHCFRSMLYRWGLCPRKQDCIYSNIYFRMFTRRLNMEIGSISRAWFVYGKNRSFILIFLRIAYIHVHVVINFLISTVLTWIFLLFGKLHRTSERNLNRKCYAHHIISIVLNFGSEAIHAVLPFYWNNDIIVGCKM